MKKVLISLVLLMFINISTVFAFEGIDINMCTIASETIEEDCLEASYKEESDLRVCLLEGMETQGFTHKDQFYIDSDNTVFCLTADMFPFLELPLHQ